MTALARYIRVGAMQFLQASRTFGIPLSLAIAEILSTLLDARAFGNLNDLDGVCAKINKATG